MANILELMKELAYPVEGNGVCFGLALMAERARQCRQFGLFKDRMSYIASFETEKKNILIIPYRFLTGRQSADHMCFSIVQ